MNRDKSVERWLNRLSPATARSHMVFMRKFQGWLRENGGPLSEMSFDELLEYQKNAEGDDRYTILDLVQTHATKLDLRASSKRRSVSSLRSFFSHSRAELPRDPTFRIRSDHLRVEGTLTIGELRDIFLSVNKAYRAVFLSMFQGGMGLAEYEHWNRYGWDRLRRDLHGDPEVIRVDLPGRKMRKNEDPYYTLIGPDAIQAIRDWIPHRPEGATCIFTNQYGNPLTAHPARLYWLRHLVKLGLIERKKNGSRSNRYGKNPHEMRDLFRSQWEKSPAKASVAEFMMGHVVDPLQYNKACRDEDWVREEYLQALPMLQIMSSDTPFGRVNGKTVKKLEYQIAALEARIEEMTPAFMFAQTMFAEKRDRDRLRESSKKPPMRARATMRPAGDSATSRIDTE